VKLKQKPPINQCQGSKQAQGDTQGLVSLRISPSKQQLFVLQDDAVVREYAISTAAKGLGEEKNSFKTPRGWHIIRAKIGAQYPANAVFIQRRFTGEIYSQDLNREFPDRDWILTRILWLSGLEPGVNRLGNVDTMQRFIYIHGTPAERPVGKPTSHGCVRMRNEDIIELFDLVPYRAKVFIEDL
jgi:L,D-transpeptidase YbiS